MNCSPHSSDLQRVPRPVAVLAEECSKGFIHPKHSHERSQLIYASAGVMSVVTVHATYIIPPQRAVWIPGGVVHEVHCRTAVSLRTLYIETDASAGLPTECCVIAVPNLLRDLILEGVAIPVEYDVDGRDGRVMQLILDEIVAMPGTRVHIPMPTSRRLWLICMEILDYPARNEMIDELAAKAGCSRRTFTRMFRKETGMSFSAWRQHARLLEAISRLATGQPVSRVAFEVGYNSQSAFTATFHRIFGTTPTEYLSNQRDRPAASFPPHRRHRSVHYA